MTIFHERLVEKDNTSEHAKNNYSSLMKKSFELSVIAPEKSEKYHHKAEEVLEQIKHYR